MVYQRVLAVNRKAKIYAVRVLMSTLKCPPKVQDVSAKKNTLLKQASVKDHARPYTTQEQQSALLVKRRENICAKRAPIRTRNLKKPARDVAANGDSRNSTAPVKKLIPKLAVISYPGQLF